MKRWKRIALGAVALLAAAVAAPALFIEVGCRAPAGSADNADRPLWGREADHRPEARTWLTYPEWHIVYSAEAFGRFLADHPPSAFPYGRHIAGFWSSYCALNRVTAGSAAAGDAKLMIYTIGLSYSIELGIKALYENMIGRLSEWIGGWKSADDAYARGVQRRYGAFMHEIPWYRFPFGDALSGLWRIKGSGVRHWERRAALSAEYGIKAGYAKLIGWATGATLGADERTLRFVAKADPSDIEVVDPRLRVMRSLGKGYILVEAPRYAQFTDLLTKLAHHRVHLVEIAGNDDIFLTTLVPDNAPPLSNTTVLLSLPLDDKPGWRRLGLSTKVPHLLGVIQEIERGGGQLEHVYDY